MQPKNSKNDGDPVVPGPESLKFDKASDKLAQAEERAIEFGADLPSPEQIARENEILRNDLLQDALHWVVRTFIRLMMLPVIAFVGVWAVHKLGPQSWRWLDPTEVDSLETILFSGAISALITTLGKNVLGRKND